MSMVLPLACSVPPSCGLVSLTILIAVKFAGLSVITPVALLYAILPPPLAPPSCTDMSVSAALAVICVCASDVNPPMY